MKRIISILSLAVIGAISPTSCSEGTEPDGQDIQITNGQPSIANSVWESDYKVDDEDGSLCYYVYFEDSLVTSVEYQCMSYEGDKYYAVDKICCCCPYTYDENKKQGTIYLMSDKYNFTIDGDTAVFQIDMGDHGDSKDIRTFHKLKCE